MRITNNNISKAIEDETGIKGVFVQNGNGYHYFYSDERCTGLMLAGCHSTSVMVTRMSDMTIDEWVCAFRACFA